MTHTTTTERGAKRPDAVVALRLRATPGSASVARRCVDALNDLSDDVRERARLALSELVSNSLRHGRAKRVSDVRVTIWAGTAVLRGEVLDRGPGFDAAARHEPAEESGRGLMLVDAVCDRWGVVLGTPMRVWFEIDLTDAPVTAPTAGSAFDRR